MRQIETAARLLTVSWIASVLGWRFLDPPLIYAAFALIDATLAAIFFRMSRSKFFPAPLCFVHVAMLVHHAGAALTGLPIEWMGLLLNRMFELALFYVGGCAAYRLASRGGVEDADSPRTPLAKNRRSAL